MANRKKEDPGMSSAKSSSAKSSSVKSSSAVLPVQEINSRTWVPFFSDLNNRHHGQRIDVEIVRAGGGAPRTELRQRRLQSISSMLGRPGERDAISITVSEDDQRMISRSISDVKQVRLFNNGGEDEKLEVESADGEKTVVVFRR